MKDLRDTYASTWITHGIVLRWNSFQLGYGSLSVTERHYASYMLIDGYQNPWIVADGCLPSDLCAALDEVAPPRLPLAPQTKNRLGIIEEFRLAPDLIHLDALALTLPRPFDLEQTLAFFAVSVSAGAPGRCDELTK